MFGTVLYSWFNINMVNLSITNVLDNSVASSNSEECFTLLTGPWLHVFGLDRQFCLDFILFLDVCKLVEHLLLLNLSVFQEHIKSGLT